MLNVEVEESCSHKKKGERCLEGYVVKGETVFSR